MYPQEKPGRLFDLLTYQQEHFPLNNMLCTRENNQWKQYSTREVQEIADRLSAGLLQWGISGGDMSLEGRDKVAIISKNRPEWLFVDLAVQQAGGVLVPIYPTIHINELAYILQHAQVKLVFVNDSEGAEKVAAIRSSLPLLQDVFSFEKTEGVRHWSELLGQLNPEILQAIERSKARIRPTDAATIIYTSGTTGEPKGVLLSHKNILSNVKSCYPLFDEIGIRGDRALSFLPLNHAFEKTATYLYIYTGVSIYYAESTATLINDLQDVKPVIFTSVPRLLEKLYEGILAKGAELKGFKRKIFDWSLQLAEQYEINQPLSPFYNLQLRLADKLVYRKWRAALGGRVRAIIVGAAACPVKLQRIFAAARLVIMEGYGLTEASPVISGNRYSRENRMFGTVGPILPGVEVKIAEDGEVLCRGDNVMMGYYKRPEETAEAIKDGWLHTGDIGQWVHNKFLKITDRKKEIFKTSGGKYVAPQPIENKMVESRWIEQMMVTGAGKKFVSALIVPAFQLLREWYATQGIPYPGNEAAVQHAPVLRLIKEEVHRLNQLFNPVEQIKKFTVLPREWTVEGGELTPTLKLKRKVIIQKYKDVVEQMYTEQP